MRSTFEAAVAAEDFDAAGILVGEVIGRIDGVRPAADIVAGMAADADRILNLKDGRLHAGVGKGMTRPTSEASGG